MYEKKGISLKSLFFLLVFYLGRFEHRLFNANLLNTVLLSHVQKGKMSK